MIRGREGRRAALSLLVALGVAVGSAGIAAAAPIAGGADAVTEAVGGEARAAVRITTQPRSVKVVAGRTTALTVKATGKSLTYRWQTKAKGAKAWKAVKGATKRTLKVRATTKNDGASFRVIVSQGRTKVTSKVARLTTISAPRLTSQPKAVTATAGTTATFTVAASGRDLTYTWQSRAAGATTWSSVGSSRTLKVSAKAALHGTSYRVIVRNAAGKATSRTVTLSVPTAPSVTMQPTSVRVTAGERVSLTVAATGSDLRYQWQKRAADDKPWTNLPGAVAPSYAFGARTAMSGDEFRVVVTNGLGSATSAGAYVFVDSTYADPAAPKTPVILTDWGVLTLDSSRHGTSEVLEENMFNDVPPAGWEYVLVDVLGCYYGTGSSTTWLDVDVEFIGSDGRSYDDGGNVMPDDIIEAGTVYSEGCTWFTAGALVPSDVVDGGVWAVTDSSSYPYSTGYIRAF